MSPFPLLLCLLLATPALAVQVSDAPVERGPLNQTPEVNTELGFADTLKLYGAGAGAAVITVPASMFLGLSLSGLSNSLYPALLSGVLAWALLPPIAVTLVEWVAGRNFVPRSTRLFPAMFAGLGVNVAIVVASILLQADLRSFTHMLAIALTSAAAIPAAVTWFIKKPRGGSVAELEWREQTQAQRPQLLRTATLVEVPL